MTFGLDSLPEGDPLSADFPAQLTALRDALVGRVVHSWPTLAARAADYAANPAVPVEPGVFVIEDDRRALYATLSTDPADWVRFEEGMPEATGQIRFRWTSDGRKSDLKSVTLPPGLFGDRPSPQLTPLNAFAAVDIGQVIAVTVSKNVADVGGSEVTLGEVLAYAYCVDEGGTLSAGQWRYGYFAATLRRNVVASWDS